MVGEGQEVSSSNRAERVSGRAEMQVDKSFVNCGYEIINCGSLS